MKMQEQTYLGECSRCHTRHEVTVVRKSPCVPLPVVRTACWAKGCGLPVQELVLTCEEYA